MKEPNIITSKNLTKIYGKNRSLDKVTLNIPRGSIYGLVGNNGAGKTTFLKILAGHIFPTSGEFTLFEANNPMDYNKVRQRCGCIIENPGFFPKMTAKQNLEYYRIQRGIPGKATVMKVLELTGLSQAYNKRFENMSLGMKQRLGLALALLGEPDLLILDEPINGLDPIGIVEFRNLLLKLNKEKHITILISSHILTELEHIATDFCLLSNGKVLEECTAEKLRENCHIYLSVKVENAKKYAALLEEKLHCTNYKIMPDNTIHIYDNSDNIKCYSELAATLDIGLLSFSKNEINLENYYMHLIGNSKEMI